jgi:toxin FitB
MTDSKLIDSSVWLSYFLNGEFRDVIENENMLLLSVLSLYEIRKKLAKHRKTSGEISKAADFIKKRSIIIPINEEIAEKAADISLKHDLPAADSLIYSTSQLHDSTLCTIDNDFRGLDKVRLLN